MSVKIFFDMDGTVFDLYGKENWLELLRTETKGAFEGGFILNDEGYTDFIDEVGNLLDKGVQFGVITWLPMQASPEYEEICRAEKLEWVKKYLPFVSEFNCVSYGIPKQNCIQKKASKMYLIDDNTEICKIWQTTKQRIAIEVNKNFNVLNALIKIRNEIAGD